MRDLRWNCQIKGCFRNLCPMLGAFDECFPGRVGMSDIDGAVEIAGKFLFLEWKSEGGQLRTGQRIMFERLTALSQKITIIVVTGHPREMRVETVQVFHGGQSAVPVPSDFDGLKARVSAWAERAQNSRLRPSKNKEAA